MSNRPYSDPILQYEDPRIDYDGLEVGYYYVHTGGGSDVFITPAGPESGYHGGPDQWR